ncbi:MAG: winged helix-turn-helix transcriptional regulator [Alphaproteobacteria bacterium]|nr:winged helix-turn-helix transcriptional regulator [Alphaproteobacteria bacterium]
MTKPNPLDVTACTLANVRQASRALSQVYDAALQPANIKATQFTLLAALWQQGPLPLSQLADIMVMDRTTLTRNLQPLIKRKLVGTAPGEDRRVRNISLTPQGKQLLDRALPLWRKAQSQLVDGLGQKRWAGLLDDLSVAVSLTQE